MPQGLRARRARERHTIPQPAPLVPAPPGTLPVPAKVLVTGATGFVGSALAARLVGEGAEVHGLTRRPEAAPPIPGVLWVRGDLEDATSLREATRGIDTVFHAGGMVGHYGHRPAYLRANVQGTMDLLAACRERGVRVLVHTSTPSVIADGSDHFGVDESHPYPTRFASPYPESKARSEQLVLAAHGNDFRTLVVRPHMIWGPGRSQWVQGMIRRAARQALWQIGAGTNRIGMTFLDDCVSAHLAAWQALSADPSVGGSPYFVHGGEPIVLWDWVAALSRACGLSPIRGSVPTGVAMILAHACDTAVILTRGRLHLPISAYLIAELTTEHYSDITRARTKLGYTPRVSVEEGLARIAAAERARRSGSAVA